MVKTFETNYDLTDKSIVSIVDDLPLWSAPFGLKLLDNIKYGKSLNILDVGSGAGFPVIEIASRMGSTCKVYGIDPWKEANDRANEKIRGWRIPNLKIVEGTAEQLPFSEDFFDLITSNNGINNVQDEELVWKEISRVIKSGGQFVFTLNLPDSMIEFYDIFTKVLEQNSLFDEIEEVDKHIYQKRKPLDHFFDLLDRNGFRLVKVIEDVFHFTYSDGTSLLNHFFIKLAFKESWINIVPEGKREKIFKQLEKELNDSAAANGCLKLTIPFVCVDAVKK